MRLERPTSLKIKVYSPQLRSDIKAAVPQAGAEHMRYDEFDGQVLLSNRSSLLSFLASLLVQSQLSKPTPESQCRISELELLTEGLLNDEDVINSLDPEPHNSKPRPFPAIQQWRLICNQGIIRTLRRVGAGLSDEDESEDVDQDESTLGDDEGILPSLFDDCFGERYTETLPPPLFCPHFPTAGQPKRSWLTVRCPENNEMRTCRLVRTGDVSSVQKMLSDWSEDIYHPDTAGQIKKMADIRDTMLLESIVYGERKIAEILLDHHANVETIRDGTNALSMAASLRSAQLIRLLLDYGADPACASILLHNGHGARSIAFLTRVVRAYRSETRRRLGPISERMHRLRELFFEDHSIFVGFAKQDTSVDSAKEDRPYWWRHDQDTHFTGFDSPGIWGPHFIDMSAQRAWAESLTILQGLCSGRAPRSAKTILLFTLLAKAMSHVLDDTETSQLTSEIVEDLSRWQILLQGDLCEQGALRRAVATVWNVDITQRHSNLPENPESLSEALHHFQVAAEDLMTRTRHLFASEQIDMSGMLSFYSDEQETTETNPANLPDSHTEAYGHLNTREEARSVPPNESDDGRSRGAPQLCIKSDSMAPELIIALAGTIFAVALAFLISKFTELT